MRHFVALAGCAIRDNDALVEVDTLAGGSVGQDVRITGNGALGDAKAQALVDELASVGGTVSIGGND